MSVCSFNFLLFVALVFVVNWILPAKYRYLWLLAASLFYYATWNWSNLIIISAVILISFSFALLIDRYSSKKLLLSLGVLILLAIWIFYKYLNVWVNAALNISICQGTVSGILSNITAPVGISFFTLVAIGYLADVYSGRTSPTRNIGKLALHVSFFPSVLSGPIESSGNFLAQIDRGTTFDYAQVKEGLRRILWGYYLKILIADRLTVIVDNGFNNYNFQTGATMAFAAIVYSIQLYADFAGYSDIVIGVGKLLGYNLLENFKRPYLTTGIRDFWNRWHISLSSWLQKYVYIPLGGSRKGTIRTVLNLLLTFIVSGLWHGTGWQFLFWGVLHAVYQIAGRFLEPLVIKLSNRLRIKTDTFSCRFLCISFNFILVTVAWIFFRSDSVEMGLSICRNILFNNCLGITLGNKAYLLGFSADRFPLLLAELALVVIVDVLHEKGRSISDWLHSQNKMFEWAAYLVLCFIVILGAVYNYGTSGADFLYTKF